MPFTDVELCAQALVRLGAQPISSLADGTAEATVAQRLYALIRDALLSTHPWTFATMQVALASVGQPASDDYSFRFALPAGCLRVISVGAGRAGSGIDYRVQGDEILANQPSITLTCQVRPPEAEFPAFFSAALVARLAAEFCLPVTESASRAELLRRQADLELRQARLIDSQQSTPRRVEDFTLIAARLG